MDIDLECWCELYVFYFIEDNQRLANLVQQLTRLELNDYISPNSASLNEDVARLLNKRSREDKDYLTAFGYLNDLDRLFWNKRHSWPLPGHIETTLHGKRYILVRHEENPIIKAIPDAERFESEDSLGTNAIFNLIHHWQEIEHSTQIDVKECKVFDCFTDSETPLKIGLSPVADHKEMHWDCDRSSERQIGIPFWCEGVKDEEDLWAKIEEVLTRAYVFQVHVLLFPELIMPESLLTRIKDWLLENNAFEPRLRLVIAGTRHVMQEGKKNSFFNRCTALNQAGDIEWEQDKRQPFQLKAEDAKKLLNIHSNAYEPTELSESLTLCHTNLGSIATPICLDFLIDNLWSKLPVSIYFVPAMSEGLSRFKSQCKTLGGSWGSSAFVCNAKPDDQKKALIAYHPSRKDLKIDKQAQLLFTVDVKIDVN